MIKRDCKPLVLCLLTSVLGYFQKERVSICFWIFVEEDQLKLFEIDPIVSLNVVGLNHGLHLLDTTLMPKLLKCILDVFGSDVAGVVGVELMEDGSESLVSQEGRCVQRGRQEFAPVDLAVALVVNLFDHISDLFLAH